MAIRVEDTDVRAIITTAITDISPYITVASMLTDRVATAGTSAGITVGTTTLFEIERWLSAHAITAADNRSSSEGVTGGGAGANISYQYKLGLNLQNSHYGQMALSLDPTGLLNKISKGIKAASMTFIGGGLSDELTES